MIIIMKHVARSGPLVPDQGQNEVFLFHSFFLRWSWDFLKNGKICV